MPIDDAEATRLRRAADQVEIIELLSRYTQLIDARDWGSLPRVFASDAECRYVRVSDGVTESFPPVRGVDAIRTWLESSLRPVETMHYMLNHVFNTIDDDRAHTTSYLMVRGTQTGGVYSGEHLRTADGWRIVSLTLEQHFNSE